MNRKIIGLYSALVISMSSAFADQKMDDCAMLPNAKAVVRVNAEAIEKSEFSKTSVKNIDKLKKMIFDQLKTIGVECSNENELRENYPEFYKIYDKYEKFKINSLSASTDFNDINIVINLNNHLDINDFYNDIIKLLKDYLAEDEEAIKNIDKLKFSYDKTKKIGKITEEGMYWALYYGQLENSIIFAHKEEIVIATINRIKSGATSTPVPELVDIVKNAGNSDFIFAIGMAQQIENNNDKLPKITNEFKDINTFVHKVKCTKVLTSNTVINLKSKEKADEINNKTTQTLTKTKNALTEMAKVMDDKIFLSFVSIINGVSCTTEDKTVNIKSEISYDQINELFEQELITRIFAYAKLFELCNEQTVEKEYFEEETFEDDEEE